MIAGAAWLATSVHTPSHSVWPRGQLLTHWPTLHIWLLAQGRAHAPQLKRSVRTLTHEVPQATKPLEHPPTQLPSWHSWRELFEHAHIGVLNRPGIDAAWSVELAVEILPRRVTDPDVLRELPAGKVIELAVTPLEISATRVRELLAEGRDPRYLLPSGLFEDPSVLAPYRA